MCSGKFAVIERMTARSSTCSRDVREQVADRNAALRRAAETSTGLPSVLPLLLNCVGSIFIANGWPCSRFSRGLGSNVSTCDGPPSM